MYRKVRRSIWVRWGCK